MSEIPYIRNDEHPIAEICRKVVFEKTLKRGSVACFVHDDTERDVIEVRLHVRMLILVRGKLEEVLADWPVRLEGVNKAGNFDQQLRREIGQWISEYKRRVA